MIILKKTTQKRKERITMNVGSLKGGGFAAGSVEDGGLRSADPIAFISDTTAESTAVFCRTEISQKASCFKQTYNALLILSPNIRLRLWTQGLIYFHYFYKLINLDVDKVRFWCHLIFFITCKIFDEDSGFV